MVQIYFLWIIWRRFKKKISNQLLTTPTIKILLWPFLNCYPTVQIACGYLNKILKQSRRCFLYIIILSSLQTQPHVSTPYNYKHIVWINTVGPFQTSHTLFDWWLFSNCFTRKTLSWRSSSLFNESTCHRCWIDRPTASCWQYGMYYPVSYTHLTLPTKRIV